MKTRKFLCMGWLPVLLCSLFLLSVTAFFEARNIEQKVKRSATNALVNAQTDTKFDWAKIETHNLGRQVLITGTAPNQQAIADAEALVEQADGVVNATHNGQALAPPPLDAPELSVNINSTEMILTGTLANRRDIELLVSTANDAFPDKAIVNRLSTAKNTATLDSTDFISALALEDHATSELVAVLRKDTLNLSGSVPEQTVAQDIERRVKDAFWGDVTGSFTVVPPPVSCEDSISNLLASGQIKFQTGNAVVSPSSFALLDQLSDTAKSCMHFHYEVSGHTDNVGNTDLNLALSQRRAQAVVNYLVSKGADKAQFTAQGHGPNQPIADNSTEQGRAKNRRIEITLRQIETSNP